ncbi:MAG: type II secretion system F family protein [Armatimonadaceae bacterium]
MATFVYDAIDPMGRSVKGRIDADSESLVLAKLHDQNFHVLSVNEEKGVPLVFGQKVNGSPKFESLVVFSRQFATMIDAGISVLKCLDILESQTKDVPLKFALGGVRKDVKGGLSLADAMAKHPNCFSKLYVNMIRAAELGGILDTILDRLSQFLEKEKEIREKIKSAMMYPIIVLVFALAITLALFFFVLPKFKEIFDSMDVEMPAMTQALFNISDFMVTYWWVGLGAIAGSVLAVRQYGMTTEGRYNLDNLKLKAPIFGELVLKIAISRFTRTFGTLLAAGVPIMRCMEIISETTGNAVLTKAINDSREAIREGRRLSTPLEESQLFPPMVTHMIDIGEETGRLSEMLVKVSEFYDQEVDSRVKGLTSLIEPILIVFLGVLVGFIAISIMGPMFKLVSEIA